MEKKDKNKALLPWGFLALGFILGSVSIFLFLKYADLTKPPVEAPPLKITTQEEPKPPEEVPPPPPEKPDEPATMPRIAIVIDDMGQDIGKLRELFTVGGPITIAVMPNMRYSKETAREARLKGWDVILHLPMEPKELSENDPGAGALLTAMSTEEITAQVERDLSAVPDVIGVNNHMGSKFTEDESDMRAVLGVIKKKNMFFLDSRTSANSVAGRLAKELGVRNADRSVFLDNTRDVAYIKGQIGELVSIAKRRGKAIGIGHPYPETLEALKATVSGLDEKGIAVVKLSDIVERK
ncbi:MAG: divergent polysaccharide deacetylase family protein [Deltaproteobacteria bacterium]|nr:divergent polysaccharide deacetylase family protein [Deltaproteobacteria bacterium]